MPGTSHYYAGKKHRLPVVNVNQGESVTEERRSVCVGKEIHATGLNIKRAESIAKNSSAQPVFDGQPNGKRPAPVAARLPDTIW
jgi:hypothetical protein